MKKYKEETMPHFSERSMKKLETCDPSLQTLFNEVIKNFDCTVLCGHRGEEEQNEAYHSRRSKKPWPQSKHNKLPSDAVDVAPYPINWNDEERFYYFAGYVQGVASQMGIKIRFGGDWDSDTEVDDQDFNDLPHFELRR
jgi:peptidoglycan L-alanyl-D-glutamate endopeptidase CwlK